MSSTNFRDRHNGPRQEEVSHMLQTIGVNSIDQLINETVPAHIRLKAPLNVSSAMSEDEYLSHAWSLGKMNVVAKNYIGLGYHPTLTPTVILRNIFENPGWYTAYTPYQAEIAQGRLEALLNFQTMVTDLTSLPIANASLLDEGTAGAEAMILFFHSRSSILLMRRLILKPLTY
jgi:glycine dehydrogenase